MRTLLIGSVGLMLMMVTVRATGISGLRSNRCGFGSTSFNIQCLFRNSNSGSPFTSEASSLRSNSLNLNRNVNRNVNRNLNRNINRSIHSNLNSNLNRNLNRNVQRAFSGFDNSFFRSFFASPVSQSPRNQSRQPTRPVRNQFRSQTAAQVQRPGIPRTTRPSINRQPVLPRVTRTRPSRQATTRAPITRAPITRAPITRAPITRATIMNRLVTREPAATTTVVTNGAKLGPIRTELQNMLQSNTQLIPAWVQLGFHACVGGCDGCLNMNDTNNKGLGGTYRQLKGLQVRHQTDITLADLVTLAAVEAGNAGIRQAGGTGNIPFRIGRKTCNSPDNSTKRGNFPQGHDPRGLDILMSEFSLSRTEAIALLGAHSLGRCRSANSGFEGPWDGTPTSLDNGYYLSLTGSRWLTAPAPGGSTQWVIDRNNIGSRMMLHADMALLRTFTVSGTNNATSCVTDCPASPDKPVVDRYARDMPGFHRDFITAYVKMLENTRDNLRNP